MKKKLTAFIVLYLVFSVPVAIQAEEKNTWEDEIIYFIMIDRFNNGDASNDFEVDINDPAAYHGGDFQGIIDKLDYIKEMGFTAIWLTPIVKNEPKGYHGYWTEDFYEVEEHFGTLEEFKTLVEKAHEKDIKIILDLVVNHTGYQHPWLNDSEKQDWFHEEQSIISWDNQKNVEDGRLAGLPDLAQENPETRKYLLDMAKWWIEETDIDGYRLDTVKHVPKDFWEEFSQEVKSVKEDFFLIGEVWHSDPTYVADYAKTGIDSFVDYPFFNEATRIFSKPDQQIGKFMDGIWKRNVSLYENPYILGNFIDNHDNKRFTRLVIEKDQEPVSRLRQALTYMYTAPGIPIIYYGTEIAMDGGNDPDNRRMMEFEDHELTTYISKLADIRNKHSALTSGDVELVYDQNGMTVFKRSSEGEQLLVAINNTTEEQTITLSHEVLEEGHELQALLGEESVTGQSDGYTFTIPSEKSEIYQIKSGNEQTIALPWMIAGATVILVAGVIFILLRKKR
ncbi:alpha-amylase family glycosyl hydrolase [Ornithinibacillus scapharcae]|uniref:alpha-amylase family glycosyl hydrolase n=1 Tax=Ornithinibacillus scapharcae TaxID=1147159 RepID=UPI000225AA66|nr:alpha-amylase family glycosyl hydrolase [Ornithinibacillus scapharcae]